MLKLMEVLGDMYNISISNPEFPYFNVTLVSKNIKILNEKIIIFSNTAMGRGMIIIEVTLILFLILNNQI